MPYRRECLTAVVIMLVGVAAVLLGLTETRSPSAKLLTITRHAAYPEQTVAGTVTDTFSVLAVHRSTVYPFRVQYSVDGQSFGFLDESSHSVVPTGAIVTVAYDTQNPGRATYVGITPTPTSDLNSSRRAAWDFIAILGVALMLRGAIRMVAVFSRLRQPSMPKTPGDSKPYYGYDWRADGQQHRMIRRGVPRTRQQALVGYSVAAAFIVVYIFLGVYALWAGGGSFTVLTLCGIVAILAGVTQARGLRRALRSRDPA